MTMAKFQEEIDYAEFEQDEPEERDEDITDICVSCNGSGEGPVDGTTCQSCKGSGVEGWKKTRTRRNPK